MCFLLAAKGQMVSDCVLLGRSRQRGGGQPGLGFTPLVRGGPPAKKTIDGGSSLTLAT